MSCDHKVTAKAMELEHWQTLTGSRPVSQQLPCPRACQPLQGICPLGERGVMLRTPA